MQIYFVLSRVEKHVSLYINETCAQHGYKYRLLLATEFHKCVNIFDSKSVKNFADILASTGNSKQLQFKLILILLTHSCLLEYHLQKTGISYYFNDFDRTASMLSLHPKSILTQLYLLNNYLYFHSGLSQSQCVF